jgi:microcystin-dependent protein
MSSTPYDRQSSFALFSAENPNTPHSGASLDAEFNAVKVALDDTQQNLAKIQDDDGVLKRGSVTRAQFDSSISIGFSAPEQWTSGHSYTAEVSTVFNASVFYICTITHVAGLAFDPVKWEQIADFTVAAVLADGSITSAKLANAAVSANKIADGSISNSKLATGAVDTNKLADGAVTFTKMLANDVQAPLASLILPAGLGPLPWSLAALPAGWDWADGGVLLSNTVFPTLRAALIADGFPHGQDGSGNPKKPDSRGRGIFCADDLGSGAAGRLSTASGMSAATLGATGGQETVTLTTPQLSSHAHASSLNDSGHTHSVPSVALLAGGTYDALADGAGGFGAVSLSSGATASSHTTGMTITNASAGSGSAHTNMPPALVCKMIIKAH